MQESAVNNLKWEMLPGRWKFGGGIVVIDHGQFGGSDGPGIHKNLQVCLDEPYGPEECPSTQCIFSLLSERQIIW